MKTKRFLFLIFALIICSFAATLAVFAEGGDEADSGIAVNDQNFEDDVFRAYVSENLDTNDDLFLSDEEILAVKRIEIDPKTVTSLKGIEFFTNLRILDCSTSNGRGNLKSIDVSACPELIRLDCSNNHITNLDVSNCRKLESLYCSNNDINALNVSGCEKLEVLSCNSNDISMLSLGDSKAIVRLLCGNNRISALDLSGCDKLVFLSCGENRMTTLNLSSCTALQELYCRYNRLTTLNVSGFTALKVINCGQNQLTRLYVSQCAALTELFCTGNSLRELNLSGCSALTKLSCGSNCLTSLDLSSCESLTTLSCEDNSCSIVLTNKAIYDGGYEGEYDLAGMPNGFDKSKILELTGAEMEDNTLKVTEVSGYFGFATVKYTYDVGHGMKADFTLCAYPGTGAADVAIDETNFPDKAFREYTATNLDSDHNGILTAEELAVVTKIDVAGLSVTSLKGIEHFANLRYLYCGENLLTELDVSANGKLEYLSCGENKLTSLDLSKTTHISQISQLTADGNSRKFTIIGNTFDLSTLPDFNTEKTSGWSGATVADEKLTITAKPGEDGYTSVAYSYNTGADGCDVTFTLRFRILENIAVRVIGLDESVYTAEGSTVTVNCRDACKVGYLEDGEYTALQATHKEDGVYSFTAPVGIAEVIIVLKGDVDGSGDVQGNDVTRLKAAYLQKITLTEEQIFAGDIDGGGIEGNDITKLKAAFLGKITLEW